jgi:cold shock protein
MKIRHIVMVLAVAAMFASTKLSRSVQAQSTSATTLKTVKGTVKWFNDAKGTGYITSEAGESIFFDKAAAKGHTIEGECVTFQIKRSPKGLIAKRVRGCPGAKPPALNPNPGLPTLPKPDPSTQ